MRLSAGFGFLVELRPLFFLYIALGFFYIVHADQSRVLQILQVSLDHPSADARKRFLYGSEARDRIAAHQLIQPKLPFDPIHFLFHVFCPPHVFSTTAKTRCFFHFQGSKILIYRVYHSFLSMCDKRDVVLIFDMVKAKKASPAHRIGCTGPTLFQKPAAL